MEEVKPNAVEEAKALLQQVTDANKESKELLDRLTQEKAERVLSGQAEAGQHREIKPETPNEYKNRIMRGDLHGEEGKY